LKERFGFAVVPDLVEKEPEYAQGICGFGTFRTPTAL
jgi:hypothetical protein